MSDLNASAMTVGDIEAHLEHFGVPGMKWGHHNASTDSGGSGGSGGATRSARVQKRYDKVAAKREASIARGQKKLDKVGGSTSKAAVHLLGKNFVQHFGVNVLSQTVVQMTAQRAPVIAAGAHAASVVVGIGLNVRDIKSGIDIGRAVKANKAKAAAAGANS